MEDTVHQLKQHFPASKLAERFWFREISMTIGSCNNSEYFPYRTYLEAKEKQKYKSMGSKNEQGCLVAAIGFMFLLYHKLFFVFRTPITFQLAG
jgi:hypothetical protein